MPALTIAENDKGEQVALVNNQWLPVQQTAANKSGQTAYLVNNEWIVDEGSKKPMTFGRAAGLTARGLAPYGTAAALGGAVLAPTGVGAPLGAAAGVGALALTDLVTGGYNALANYTNLPRIPTGSEAVQELFGTPRPQSPGEQMYVNALEAATGAGMQAGAARALSRVAPRGSTTRNVLREGSRQPGVQMAGAVGASAAVDTAREAGIDDPVLLAASGFVGGTLAGGAAGLRRGASAPSIDQVRGRAKAKYAEVDSAGVMFDPASYSMMIDDVVQRLTNQGYNATAHTALAGWLSRLERTRNTGSTLTELDSFRSELQKRLGPSADPNTRRLMNEAKDAIDDYVSNAGPADIMTGNLPQAQAALGDARRLWTSVSKAEKIEELLRRASVHEGSQSAAIRNEFRSLALNERRMRQFSPVEREFIERVAKGTPLPKALEWFGEKSMQAGGILAAGGAAQGAVNFLPGIDPTTGIFVGGGMVGAGAGMKGLATALTKGQARNLQGRTLGQRSPVALGRNALLNPILQTTIPQVTIDPELAAAIGYPQDL